MTDEHWVPLPGQEAVDTDSLFEGVPEWLYTSFWNWVKQAFTASSGSGPSRRTVFNRPLLRKYERVCRVRVAYDEIELVRGITSLRGVVQTQGREIQLADFLLAEGASGSNLDKALLESGSVWTVGTRVGRGGLERRVPEGVRIASDAVMARGAHAGQRLAEAWTALYGAAPDPSRAYSLAVKAVEDAAVPLVSPKDLTATLGKLIGQLDASSANWHVPVVREIPDGQGIQTVISMMRTLWIGQADRHGGMHDPDLVITQDAAEIAVALAVALVQLFVSGLVRKS